MPVKPRAGERFIPPVDQTDPELSDEWEQTKFVRSFEWPRPPVLRTRPVVTIIDCEGVMEVGESCEVP